jgi:cytosine deaminase
LCTTAEIIGRGHNRRVQKGSAILHGVELTIQNDPACVRMMEDFIRENPNLWNEDIGEA